MIISNFDHDLIMQLTSRIKTQVRLIREGRGETPDGKSRLVILEEISDKIMEIIYPEKLQKELERRGYAYDKGMLDAQKGKPSWRNPFIFHQKKLRKMWDEGWYDYHYK